METDPALPGSDVDASRRRLAAGDWARIVGPLPSVRGVGKIVDGLYATRDSVLLQAKVEFARGSYWFSPEALARVLPDEEADLCDLALERKLLGSDAADRVRAAVERFRRGQQRCVRTPGLLDRLWACFPESGASKLAAFFDEAVKLIEERAKTRVDVIVMNDAPPPLRVYPVPPVAPAVPRVAPTSLSIDRAPIGIQNPLEFLLDQLDVGDLRVVAANAGVSVDADDWASELRETLSLARVDISLVLEPMSEWVLRRAALELGLSVLGSGDVLRERIANHVEPRGVLIPDAQLARRLKREARLWDLIVVILSQGVDQSQSGGRVFAVQDHSKLDAVSADELVEKFAVSLIDGMAYDELIWALVALDLSTIGGEDRLRADLRELARAD